MKAKLTRVALVMFACAAINCSCARSVTSSKDTAPKKAITPFIDRVTKESSPDFVKPEDRVGTLDNDGTFWAEKPIYFQFQFAVDRVKTLARAQHPDWKKRKPFNYILGGDIKALLADGKSMMAFENLDQDFASFLAFLLWSPN